MLADVLEMVQREITPMLAISFVTALLLMWLSLGSIRLALLCMSPTLVSLFALVGLMAISDMPFNYLNIIVVPVLIGTTVDAGVHLITRLSDAHGEFPAVFGETGRAIVGGLITSGVGFGLNGVQLVGARRWCRKPPFRRKRLSTRTRCSVPVSASASRSSVPAWASAASAVRPSRPSRGSPKRRPTFAAECLQSFRPLGCRCRPLDHRHGARGNSSIDGRDRASHPPTAA